MRDENWGKAAYFDIPACSEEDRLLDRTQRFDAPQVAWSAAKIGRTSEVHYTLELIWERALTGLTIPATMRAVNSMAPIFRISRDAIF